MSDKRPAPEKEKWDKEIVNSEGKILVPAERINPGKSYKEYRK